MSNPPYSIVEIQVLLSQALDGELEPDQRVELDALLEKFPEYQAELVRLQAMKGALQASLERQAEQVAAGTGNLWGKIADQLKSDQGQDVLDADPEFISAYYDGEIPSSPELEAFEHQLYRNAEANRLLAEVGEVSDTVRQFGYRLEAACTLDITGQVMSAFLEEQNPLSASANAGDISNGIPASDAEHRQAEFASQISNSKSTTPDSPLPNSFLKDEPVDVRAEMLSAYVDQELSPRETIEANRLIENDADAKSLMGTFNRLSEHIQSVSEQLKAQAPDCWPAIRTELEKQLDDPAVVPLRKPDRFGKLLRLGLPTAAAAVVVMLMLPAYRATSFRAAEGVAWRPAISNVRLATVPGGASLQDQAQSADSAVQATQAARASREILASARNRLAKPAMKAAGLGMEQETAPMPASAAAPVTDLSANSMELASVSPQEARIVAPGRRSASSPSSEEYLFKALSEQMPEEDISNILGK